MAKYDKKSLRSMSKILVAVSLGVIGQLGMKQGMNQVGFIDHLDGKVLLGMLNPWVIIGLSAYGLAMLIWLAVLAEADLSFAYPMLSLGYILIAFFSWLLFDDHITLIRWVGIITICFGVYLVSLKEEDQ